MGRLNVKFPQGKLGGFSAYCERPRGQRIESVRVRDLPCGLAAFGQATAPRESILSLRGRDYLASSTRPAFPALADDRSVFERITGLFESWCLLRPLPQGNPEDGGLAPLSAVLSLHHLWRLARRRHSADESRLIVIG